MNFKLYFILPTLLLLPVLVSAQGPNSQYPTSLDTPCSLFQAANSSFTTLNGAINSSQTTITVNSTASFSNCGGIRIDSEIMYYTSKSAAQFLGVTRGVAGTAAASHGNTSPVRAPLLADHHNVLNSAIVAIETKLGIGSSPASGAATGTCIKKNGDGTTSWQDCATGSGGGDVTAAANLTDNAIVRGDGGAKGVQTSAVSIDDEGNISTPKSINTGVGGTEAGFFGLVQGTAHGISTNTIGHTAPTSVTGYNFIYPGTAGDGVLVFVNSAGLVTASWVSTTGTGSLVRANGGVFQGGTPIIFEGATDNAFETTVVVTDPTADRNFTIPNADSVAVQPNTCAGTDKVSAINASGQVICSTDVEGTGGVGTLPYDVAVHYSSTPTTSSVFRFVVPRSFDFASSFAGTVCNAGTAATAQADFIVAVNAVTKATLRFAAAGTTCTIVGGTTTSLVSGDVVTITAPASADATLAEVAITLRGTIP